MSDSPCGMNIFRGGVAFCTLEFGHSGAHVTADPDAVAMMTPLNDIPAFPLHIPDDRTADGHGIRQGETFTGMTLRDYFAAKAMQGYLSRHDLPPQSETALRSYSMADA